MSPTVFLLFLHAYVYNMVLMLIIQIFCYICVYPYLPLGICITLARGVSSDSPGFSCPGFGAWSVWVPLVADQSSAAVVWTIRSSILPGPCVPLEFPCCKLVSALLLFMFVYFLVFSRLRHSGDVNIIVIFITSGDNSVIVLLCWNV